MGAETSRLETSPEAYNRNFSEEHGISAWEGVPPKNADYYNGSRFFKIDKDKYRCYERGWLYGHTYRGEGEKDATSQADEEHKKLKDEIAEIKRRVAELADHELAL